MTGSPAAWLRSAAIGAVLCAILILPVVWDASQGWLFPDGTSYLDMAGGATSRIPRGPVQKCLLEPCISRPSGADDGGGAARARR